MTAGDDAVLAEPPQGLGPVCIAGGGPAVGAGACTQLHRDIMSVLRNPVLK